MLKKSSLFALALLSLSASETKSKPGDAITNSNARNINTASHGAPIISPKGEIKIDSSYINLNTGHISTPSGHGVGAIIQAHDILRFMPNGSIVNHNTGTISNHINNYGVFIQANTSLNDMNTCALDTGTVVNLNDGTIHAGIGAGFSFPKILTLSGVSFSNINTSPVINQGIGALLSVGQDLNLSAKTLSFLNTAAAAFNPTDGTSSGTDFVVDGNVNISGTGGLSLKNDAALNSTHEHLAIGADGTVLGNLTMTGGTLTLHNTPETLANSVGVKLDVIGAMTMTNAAASNINEAKTVTGGNSNFGSQFSAASMALASSTFTNTNAQALATTGTVVLNNNGLLTNTNTLPAVNGATVTGGFGSQITVANGITVAPGGLLTNSNNGSVNADSGTFFGSDVLVQNNGITMTGGTINSTHSKGNTVSGSAQNAGASIRTLGTGGLTFSGGAINIENNGAVDGGTGSLFSLAGGLALSQPGTPTTLLNITNTVDVASGFGSQLKAQTGSVAASGGVLNLFNTSGLSGSTGAAAHFSNTGSSAFTIAGGLVNVTNTGDLNNAVGASLTVAGTLAMTGGVLTNSNTGITQPPLASTPGALVSAGTIMLAASTLNNTGGLVQTNTGPFTVAGGTLINTNSLTVDSAHVSSTCGSQISVAATLPISGGTVIDNLNSGTVSNSAGGMVGSLITVKNSGGTAAPVTMSGGALNIANSGAVSQNNIGSAVAIAGGMNLSGGIVNCANTGSIDAGIGSQLQMTGDMSLNSLLNILNNASLDNPGVGSELAANNFTLNPQGELNLINSQALNMTTAGSLGTVAGNFTMVGGSLNLSNASPLVNAIGARLNISKDLIMQGGTIKNVNSGTTQGQGSGSELHADNITMSQNAVSFLNDRGLVDAVGNFTISAGVYTNTNTLTVDSTKVSSNYGTLTHVGIPTFNGGTINNTNSGSVSHAKGGVFGSLFLLDHQKTGPHSMHMNAGTFNIANTGTVSHNNVGSAVVMDKAGPFIFSGGTINCTNDAAVMTGVGSQFNLANNDIAVAGTLKVANSFSLTHPGIGSQLIARNFDLNSGGSLLISNNPIDMAMASAGAQADIAGDFQMNGGSLSIANTSNLISATGSALNIGGSFIQQTGAVALTNTGTAQTGGIGSRFSAGSITMLPGSISFTNTCGLVQTKTSFTLSDGAFFNTNNRPANSAHISSTFGAECSIGTKADLSGGHYINSNTNDVNDERGGFIGALTRTGGDMTMSGNTKLTIVNTGNVAGNNTGSAVHTDGTFNMTTGNTLDVFNNAAGPIGGIGSELSVAGTFNMTGGTVNNHTNGEFSTSLIQAGSISISDGLFINNAHVKADRIELTGGTLAGSGIFDPDVKSAVVSNRSGTVEPGNLMNHTSPISGPMTINGTYTQGPNGILHIGLSPDGASLVGNLTATQASLGGHLVITPIGGTLTPHGLDHIELLTVTNPLGLSGIFSNVNLNNVPGSLSPSIVYGSDADHAYVRLVFGTPLPPAPPMEIPAVTTYMGGETYQTMFITINRNNFRLEREMQNLRHRFSKREKPVAEQPKTKKSIYTPSLARASAHQPASSHVANQIGSPQPTLAFMNYEIQKKQFQLHEELGVEKIKDYRWNLFVGPTGGFGKVNTRDKQLGAHFWDVGALAGFDYAFEQVGIGLVVDFDRTQVEVEQHWGRYHFEHLHSSFFATYAPHILPQLAFNGILGGAYDWYDIHRRSVKGTAVGHTRGTELDALFGVEYVFSGQQFSLLPKKLELIPRAYLQYIYVDINRFTERDAGAANVKMHSQFGKSLRTGLDIWAKYTWDWTNFTFSCEGDLGWQREYFDQKQSIHFTPVGTGGPTTPIRTYGAGRDTMTAGLDFFFELFKKYSLELMYDFQYNHLFYDHAFYLGFDVRF